MIRLQNYKLFLIYANFSAAKCVFAHLRPLFMESGGENLLQHFLSVTDDYAVVGVVNSLTEDVVGGSGFLTLYIVGLDNESIGILMQQELRTLWNRKQKIKDRINENDLDGWIEKEVIETVIRRQMEEK